MRHQIRSAVAAFVAVAPPNMACWADGPSAIPEPRFEVYTGGGYDGYSSHVTSSFVWGVLDPLAHPGFLLKLDGLATLFSETNDPLFSNRFRYFGLKNVSDAMAGYQFQYGQAWIKLYAGAAYKTQVNLNHGMGVLAHINVIGWQEQAGAAAAVQCYWPMSDRIWSSMNVTWLQPDDSISVYARSAYKIYRSRGGLQISAGAETNFSYYQDVTEHSGPETIEHYGDYIHGGAVLNLRYGTNDLSLSGGLSHKSWWDLSRGSHETVWRPYASISFGRQF